jgi:hypothetical protein
MKQRISKTPSTDSKNVVLLQRDLAEGRNMRKSFIYGLLSVTLFIAVIIIFTKGGSSTEMASDPPNPPSFAIGPYKLDTSIIGLKGLVELTPREYDIFPKTFKGEKIYNGPNVTFLGSSWKVMLGVVEGKIHKINPYLEIYEKEQANEIAMKTLMYCKSKLGEPARQQTGFFIWDTNDGNVVLQTAETSEGFALNLFSTSRAVRSFRPLN